VQAGTERLRRKAYGDGILWRRKYRCIIFEPVSVPFLPKTLPKYHTVYRDADPELIESIDQRFAHGTLGHWAAFTHSAHQICRRSGLTTLDETVAETIYKMQRGAAP